MEKEIVFTKRFLKNVDKVTGYILKEWNAGTANTFLEKVHIRVEQIKRNSEIGKPSKYKEGVRSVLVKPHNRLYYRNEKKRITILALIDLRRDPAKNRYK
jgi:plasmid stabilization system protein ParE